MIQIFIAHGTGQTGPTEGSTRGPRGPKNQILLLCFVLQLVNIMFLIPLSGLGYSNQDSSINPLKRKRWHHNAPEVLDQSAHVVTL